MRHQLFAELRAGLGQRDMPVFGLGQLVRSESRAVVARLLLSARIGIRVPVDMPQSTDIADQRAETGRLSRLAQSL